MGSRNWTKDQKDAIESRNGSILVSAAAGSGKTAVLVERIIKRILSEENPCNADELLVVTFTRAAAAEIKERIRKQLSEELLKNPENKHLLKQQMLLDNAKIGTIDSFCADLVKENFNALGINPEYKLVEENELKTIKEEAVNLTIESLYEEDSQAFKQLIMMSDAKNTDKELAKKIIKINEYALAYPFPDLWLDKVLDFYDNALNSEVSESVWGKIILNYIIETMEYFKALLQDSLEIGEEIPEIYDAYSVALNADLIDINSVIDCCNNGEWDSIFKIFEKNMERFKTPGKGLSKSPIAVCIKNRRESYKSERSSILKLMSANSEQHKEDMEYIKPLINELIHSVKLYRENLMKLKSEKNCFDFSDIMHMAVNLLAYANEDGFKRTKLAEQLSLQFKEILIDEYQDVNEAQDILFSALSRNEENLFIVGDAKQSIYGFRMAMPQIFISKRESLNRYEKNNYPAKITLGCNFRSRKGITDITNFVFKQLMSEKIGEIEYNEDEELIAKASYSEKSDPNFELHILEIGKEDSDDEMEARYIANMINSMISSGMTVKDGDIERKVRYGDFCVLQRSTKGTSGIYSKVFSEESIPAKIGRDEGFFEAKEIGVMLSLLSIIDNPLQDIPLISVLMSPIFGFSSDDVTYVRLLDKSASIYSCIKRASDENFLKARDFLVQFEKFRDISVSLSIRDFISYLYEETGYLAIVEAMTNGKQRKENLYLLLDYADKYEKTNDFGISGFMRFIEKLKQLKIDLAPANVLLQAENVVHVMTIHKSKGLEFPICIISNCDKKFMKDDFQKSDMIIYPQTGIGIKRCNINRLQKFNTLPYSASKIMLENSQMSEELRLLYVAMTRAKEYLIMVAKTDDTEKSLTKISSKIIAKDIKLPYFAIKKANNIYEWIAMCMLRHVNGFSLRNIVGAGENIVLGSDSAIKTVIKSNSDFNSESLEPEVIKETASPNMELLKKIRDRVDYVYPYSVLSNVISKMTASEFAHFDFDLEHFAASRPAFIDREGLTPSQKGTIMHKFTQFCDYNNAKNNLDNEISRLVENEFISVQEADALDKQALKAFFNSEIAQRIFASNNVMREKKVLINIGADEISDLDSDTLEDERILVEGVADCVFEENGKLVILDFKTDHVKLPDVLAERYSKQLEIYKRAFKECMEMEVKETWLYSFYLNEAVII